MKEASLVEAEWNVELNATCPACLKWVDLLEAPDFWDGRKLDVAEHGTDRSRNIAVQCPECYHEFRVTCVY